MDWLKNNKVIVWNVSGESQKVTQTLSTLIDDNINAVLLQGVSWRKLDKMNLALECDDKFTCIAQWIPYTDDSETGVGFLIRHPDQFKSFEAGPGLHGKLSVCQYAAIEFNDEFIVYASVHFYKKGSDEDFIEDMDKMMQHLTDRFPDHCIILAGDFNRSPYNNPKNGDRDLLKVSMIYHGFDENEVANVSNFVSHETKTKINFSFSETYCSDNRTPY